MKTLIIILFLFTLVGCASHHRAQITGTYSDLHYAEDAGDLVGMEIRIVGIGSTTKFQGTLQDCPGVAGYLQLITIHVDEFNHFKFTHPNPSLFNVQDGPVTFEGTIHSQFLEGTFHAPGKTMSSVRLPRRPSYWD